MFKNMKLAPKLILIGSLLSIIPLTFLGVVAVTRSGSALEEITNEQMATRTNTIAMLVDAVLEEETKLILAVSILNDTIRAAEAAYEEGIDQAEEELTAFIFGFSTFCIWRDIYAVRYYSHRQFTSKSTNFPVLNFRGGVKQRSLFKQCFLAQLPHNSFFPP